MYACWQTALIGSSRREDLGSAMIECNPTVFGWQSMHVQKFHPRDFTVPLPTKRQYKLSWPIMKFHTFTTHKIHIPRD